MRLLTISLLLVTSHAYKFDDCEQKPAALSQVHRINGKLYSHQLDFFYQKGLSYSAIYAFTDVFLKINLTDADSYQFYQGPNCTTVQELYDNDNRYFGLLRKAALLRSHHLNPFNDTIVGVSTTEPYEISLLIWKVNYVRVAVYISATLLFLLASKLVRNAVFYYTSGCSFGLLASLLLVGFIVWRVAPKKTIGVPILIGGWSIAAYMLNFAWTNMQEIMLEYQKYVIGYFGAALLISLAVCYKRGPPTDARSHDIAQWTLQLVAIALIYFSVQVIEVSVGTIGALILQQLTKGILFAGIRWYFAGLGAFWRKMFPKSRRLLNEDEYEEQAQKTTKEQLALLREYCKQEGSRPWKLASNVRNSRSRRLARFVEGDDHVTDDETYAHEMSAEYLNSFVGDDDDFSDEDLITPDRTHFDDENYDEEEREEEEWDEVVVKRRTAGNRGSVQSIRVPRSVATRLLTPYQNLNKSLGAGMGYRRENGYNNRQPASMNRYYSEHRPARSARNEEPAYLHRPRRLDYDLTQRIEPQRTASSSASSVSSIGGLTPSEYMRRARRLDGASKTPTRRPRTTETEEADD